MHIPLAFTIYIELIFVAICFTAAFFEKQWFKENRTFKHWWGIVGYSLFVLVVFISTKNIMLCVACFLIGEVFFAPFLNLIRGHEFFYENNADPKGSVTDRMPNWLQRILYFASVIALIILQFYLN